MHLTDVTDDIGKARSADIVLHYIPRAGGVKFGGVAHCNHQQCNNVVVRSDVPDHPDSGEVDYDRLRV